MTDTTAAPVTAAQLAEIEYAQAWLGTAKKIREALPRIAVVEVTDTGDRCFYTLHNIDGKGLPVAELRRASLTDKHPGKTFAVRDYTKVEAAA